MFTNTDRIRMLNDQHRQNLTCNHTVLTPGIAGLGADVLGRLTQEIAKFDSFDANNDPYGEHDFGSLEFEGIGVMFKIDYFDVNLKYASPNPADPQITRRVITLMRSEEY